MPIFTGKEISGRIKRTFLHLIQESFKIFKPSTGNVRINMKRGKRGQSLVTIVQ